MVVGLAVGGVVPLLEVGLVCSFSGGMVTLDAESQQSLPSKKQHQFPRPAPGQGGRRRLSLLLMPVVVKVELWTVYLFLF